MHLEVYSTYRYIPLTGRFHLHVILPFRYIYILKSANRINLYQRYYSSKYQAAFANAFVKFMHLSFTELKHFIWGRGCQSFLGFFFCIYRQFFREGVFIFKFPNNFIWTRKIVKEMCTGDSQCTIWTSFLTPPLLTRSVNDWHWRAGTYVYHKCIPRIYIICQHKHKTVDKQPFYWRSNKKTHLLSRNIYMYVCAVFILTAIDL